MAAARGRRTSFGAPHASTRVIDESRTRPARKGPRRVRRSIGRVGRARGSARRGLGLVGPLGKNTSGRSLFFGSIGATDFLSSRNATFEEETTRLTRRDTSRRAVSDLETPPCDAAKVRATARPGIAASSPSRARRAHRSRRLGTRRSRRVDAFGFGLGRSTTVGWRCARDRQPSPSPHERRHSD